MKILVLSDTHDHIWNLQRVIEQTKGKVEAAIHCGDWCAGFTSAKFSKLGIPVYGCLGNNDEDHIKMSTVAGASVHWTPLADEYGEVELGGRRIAFCHYPRLAQLLAGTGEYDAVFHGHNHQRKSEMIGKTLLLNPGAVCGIQKGESGVASYALYDTKTNTAEIVEL